MTSPADRQSAPPRPGVGLWLGMVGPPVIWLIQFQIRFSLAGASPGSGRHYTVVAAGLIALALLVVLGVRSRRDWQLAGASPLDRMSGVPGRVRFMAMLGIMSAVLFFLVTAAQTLAHFFLLPGRT